jgi:tetratricopeptide (TPR) repeat protein
VASEPETKSEAVRPAFDAVAVARDATEHGLVVVAGAGLSMGPPSSLPNWTAINNAFLENLALRLAAHTGGEVGYDVAEFVLDRRETADVAQPDLQAQLAEESIGEQYFALFKPLDIVTWNDGHAAIAALASTGLLRAVVTTNFDRLIELAFEAAGTHARVYCAPEDFEWLSNDLVDGPAPVAIPVIKVHGSVDRAATMVDTLRQRVVGRPKALEAALARLFCKHAVLVVGFSGADLAYDPHYLGLRQGAAGSPSFTVVNRKGDQPKAALADLVASAGAQARIVDGTLPECLIKASRALGQAGSLVRPAFDVEMEFPGMRAASLPSQVREAWAQSISPVRAAVVLAAIAQAAGSDDAAFRLLMRTMPHHLKANLQGDPALPTQLNMIASTLIEACHVDPELSADAFQGEAALRVLSVKGVQRDAESLALLALGLALCGHAAESDAAGLAALKESRENFKATVRADVLCTLARFWTLTERWSSPHVQGIRQTYDLMFDWGDEPRRARVGAMLARFLVETGELDAAAAIIVDCQRVVRRLNLAITGNDLIAAGGRLYLAEGRHEKALSALTSACRHYESAQHHLRLAETLLPLAEAAAAAGNADALKLAVGRFDELLPLVPGMALPRSASRVRLFCSVGAFEEARGVVKDLLSLGKRWGDHPWIPELAGRLEQRIAAAAAGG